MFTTADSDGRTKELPHTSLWRQFLFRNIGPPTYSMGYVMILRGNVRLLYEQFRLCFGEKTIHHHPS